MNVFDYFFESTKNLTKDFVLGSKETITFKKLYDESLKTASYLKNTIGENQKVILISPNSVFFLTAYLGILKSGNACIPLNFDIEQHNLDFILETTESSTVFIAENQIQRLNFSSKLSLIDEKKLVQFTNNQEIKGADSFFDVHRIAEIIFTSGSTGKPKGVMISHQNIISNTNSIIDYLKLSSKDIMAVVLPFFYCYGLSLLHTHLRVGASIVFNNTFIFLGSVVNDLKNYKCTGFAGVPSHFQILLKKSQTFKLTKFPDLRYVTQAGGKLHSVFIEEFVEAFPSVDFYVMYGQTEATARLSYLSPTLIKTKTSSIGKAIPGVELKIVNEIGEEVRFGEEGELLARGENVMLGYYKDEVSTNKTIKNGWLYTGDIAKKDNDGYIYLIRRKKEIIKIGGNRVSPKEIEEVILSVPNVMDCTITGINDELLGETIKAKVIVNQIGDERILEEQILKKCKENLSLYKIPRIIEYQYDMNLKLTGKKKRD